MNDLQIEKGKVPSSAEEGWREVPGWCWSRESFFLNLTSTTPSARILVASQYLFDRASTPPLLRRGYASNFTVARQFIHTFIDRAYI